MASSCCLASGDHLISAPGTLWSFSFSLSRPVAGRPFILHNNCNLFLGDAFYSPKSMFRYPPFGGMASEMQGFTLPAVDLIRQVLELARAPPCGAIAVADKKEPRGLRCKRPIIMRDEETAGHTFTLISTDGCYALRISLAA